MRFQEFDLHPDVQRGIDESGFVECTEVQSRTIPHSLAGSDVTVQSQTGTGKTATFLIPIFNHLLKPEYAGAKALILAPTRELAVQIEQEAIKLGKYLPFSTACFYGGVGYVKQEDAIRSGAQILIATPGRLLDFVSSGKLGFQEVRFVVIDEADRLFDMGFYPDIQQVFRRLPAKDRMVMLFSATMSTRVLNIAWKYMNDPVEVIVTPEQMTVETVTQELYHVSMSEKMGVLLGTLKRDNPSTALVFANTKRACEEISRRLELNGYKSRFIIGDLPQRQRLRLIEELKAGEIDILVATDVAARGLHVNDLDMVINYDLPEDPENYVHRIGRTARQGKQGRAVSLACERFVFGLEAIEDLIGMKIPVQRFNAEDLVQDRSSGTRIVVGRDDRTRGGAPHPSRSPRPVSGGRQPRHHSGRAGREGAEQPPAPPRGPARAASPRDGGSKPSERVRPHGHRPAEVARDKPQHRPKPGGRPSKVEPVSKRLEYYKEKYGEDFVEPTATGAKPSGRKPAGRRPDSRDQKPGGTRPGAGRPVSNRPVSKPDNERSVVKAEGRPEKSSGKKGVLGGLLSIFRRKDTDETAS